MSAWGVVSHPCSCCDNDTLLIFIAVGLSVLFYTLAWSRKQSGLGWRELGWNWPSWIHCSYGYWRWAFSVTLIELFFIPNTERGIQCAPQNGKGQSGKPRDPSSPQQDSHSLGPVSTPITGSSYFCEGAEGGWNTGPSSLTRASTIPTTFYLNPRYL